MKKLALFTFAATLALPFASVEAMSDAKSVKRGKKVAVKQCVACHDITSQAQKKVGPPLWGLFGKPAGTVEGYQYSQTHLDKAKADSIVWDEATLDIYLKNPQAYIPGNKMVYPGLPKEKHRRNLINYMKTLK